MNVVNVSEAIGGTNVTYDITQFVRDNSSGPLPKENLYLSTVFIPDIVPDDLSPEIIHIPS